MKNKKILLIGGSGFIGLHLAKKFSEIRLDTTIMCKNPGKIKKLGFAKKIRFLKCNITDYKTIESNIKNRDIIINLASVINQGSNFDPYIDLEVNCKGNLNVLEARKKLNPNSRYIFIGSRAQFGKVKEEDLPIPEDYCQRPISLYGIHKLTAENYCELYKRAFGLKSIIIRLSQVYGPSLTKEKTHNIIDDFVKKAIKNEEFYVNGYGMDIKDWIYIDDVVNLIVKILDSNIEEGIFNVGSGKKIRLIDIAKKVIELCNSGRFKAVPFPKEIIKFELGSFYFNISMANKEFGWKPKINLDEGIKRTINFIKNQNRE